MPLKIVWEAIEGPDSEGVWWFRVETNVIGTNSLTNEKVLDLCRRAGVAIPATGLERENVLNNREALEPLVLDEFRERLNR